MNFTAIHRTLVEVRFFHSEAGNMIGVYTFSSNWVIPLHATRVNPFSTCGLLT